MIENLKKIISFSNYSKESEIPKLNIMKKSKSKSKSKNKTQSNSKTPTLNKQKFIKPICISDLNIPHIKPKTVENISQRQKVKYNSSINIIHNHSRSKNYDNNFEPSPYFPPIKNKEEINNNYPLFNSNIDNLYDENNINSNNQIEIKKNEKENIKENHEINSSSKKNDINKSISDITKKDNNESKDCINEEFAEDFNISDEIKINDIENFTQTSIKIVEKDSINQVQEKKDSIKNNEDDDKKNTELNQNYKEIKSRNEKENFKNSYENIRIIKSFEGENNSHDINNFDIEYISRCFGLMIKKYIEDGDEYFHISELLNEKKTFEFFNSDYNSKINLFDNFFEICSEQKKSNLLCFEEKENFEEENILNKKLLKNKFMNLNEFQTKEEEKSIYFGHIMFKNKNIDNDFPLKTENKKKINNIYDYKNELIIINNFFNKTNKENLQFKNCKSHLGIVQEIDSIKYCKDNKLDSIYSKKSLNIFTNSQIHNEKVIDRSKISISDKENINEELNNTNEENNKSNLVESDYYESNYIIDIQDNLNLKEFLYKSSEIFDDDYEYFELKITNKKLVSNPNPNSIFEFIVNVMIMTKMEKEIIIIALVYIERFIFNSGILLTSRNWKRLLFTSMIIASKFWDDDSFENNHFSQVFNHLSIGEINLMERTFLELINYKTYIKFSEYFKYFFIIKLIALKLNFNGECFISVSLKEMMQIQEFNFLQQQKYFNRRKILLNNSTYN